MNYIIGIDIGSSITKIVIMTIEQTLLLKETVSSINGTEIEALTERLECQLQNILLTNNLPISNLLLVALTGVGASNIEQNIILNVPAFQVKEFEAIGTGGLWCSGRERGIVMNIGTGTAFVKADKDSVCHLGGSGVGGGTLLGLAYSLTKHKNIDIIKELAQKGDLEQVDLHMRDISNETASQLPDYVTACNFGKVSASVKDEDIILGIMNMIYQTVGTMAVFLGNREGMNDIIVTGSTAILPQADCLLGRVGELYGMNFYIQKDAVFVSAIGAVLCILERNRDF